MKSNSLKLVGKYAKVNDAISDIAVEDLKKHIEFLQGMNCMFCEKCDFKNCAIYNICVACDMNASNENGCPFKL